MSVRSVEPIPGALVISLDFELRWGVRDRYPLRSPYDLNLLGAREVVPRILDLFEKFNVAATWATVGFLFAESRAELQEFLPNCRPEYHDRTLNPYDEALGLDEADDPLHFAPQLVRRIRGTPRQEVATHTFAHYYCGEPGQSAESFRADLIAARAIAKRHGIELRSIVFPRNQHNRDYDAVLLEHGIRAYRGNPASRLWRFTNVEESNLTWKRAGRLVDAYIAVAGHGVTPWSDVRQSSGLSNVRASCFLRPYHPRLRQFEQMRINRVRRAIRHAARTRTLFHLWWHPHNFGRYQQENLDCLRRVLLEYAACRSEYGMMSLSMSEVDAIVTSRHNAGAGDAGRSGEASVRGNVSEPAGAR